MESAQAAYSYSSAAGLARGGFVGDVAVHHSEASVAGRWPLTEACALTYGAGFSLNHLDAERGVPLPNRLGELTLNFGLTQRFSLRWSAAAYARPGFYSDLENFSSDTFNVPLLVMATYSPRPTLSWIAGVGVNAFSDSVVMPVAGVRWLFAPRWTFGLGFPRAGVTWDASKQLSLRAGLSIQGGSYRLTENLGSPAPGIARLANTYVQYREIRFGAGASWKLTDWFTLAGEAGVMTDRKFEFYDRDYTLNGRAAPYLTLSVSGRF